MRRRVGECRAEERLDVHQIIIFECHGHRLRRRLGVTLRTFTEAALIMFLMWAA